MSQTVSQPFPVWKRILFSDIMLSKSKSHRIAYLGVLTALSIVANMFFEIKFLDVQFSITIFISMISGILIGPLFGFLTAFLGDFIGYLYNSWGLVYMPWVALSCATTALIAGLVMNGIKLNFKGGVFIKLAIVCALSLVICKIAINTTGLYVYFKTIGFSQKTIDYLASKFGSGVTYWGYCFYRLFFLGQIYNCIVNYALLFIAVPALCAVKPLKLSIL